MYLSAARPRDAAEHVSGPARVARLLLCAAPGLAAACVHYTAVTQPGLSVLVQVLCYTVLQCTLLYSTVLYVLCAVLYVLVQVLAWAVLVGSVPASLVATPPSHQQRSPFLCLALLAAYNLLSLSYEVREALVFVFFLHIFDKLHI